MFEFIKKLIRKNPFIYNIIFMIFVYGGRQSVFYFHYLLRKMGVRQKFNYDELLKFKSIHQGKRCFIVGTGPSLKLEDLDLIKNEFSISVNSIVLSYGDTSWRPTYYAIQDKRAYEKLEKEIKKAKMPFVFIGISNKRLTPISDIDFIPYPLNLLDHGKRVTTHLNKFSQDAFKCVYDGHSITYSAIELAVYMGFKEIVLLGIDCDYSRQVNHVKAYCTQDDKNAAFLMRESYKIANDFANKNDFRIINCTRNAKLDVFEKRALEEVLKQDPTTAC